MFLFNKCSCGFQCFCVKTLVFLNGFNMFASRVWISLLFSLFLHSKCLLSFSCWCFCINKFGCSLVVWFWEQTAWFSLRCSIFLFEHMCFPYLFPYENNKESVCVCVGSLPPPWIPYQFPYEDNEECVCVCVCELPPSSLDSLSISLMKTIRNACVSAPSLLLGFLINFLMKTIRNVCAPTPSLLPGSLIISEWKQSGMCACVGSVAPLWVHHYCLCTNVKPYIMCCSKISRTPTIKISSPQYSHAKNMNFREARRGSMR